MRFLQPAACRQAYSSCYTPWESGLQRALRLEIHWRMVYISHGYRPCPAGSPPMCVSVGPRRAIAVLGHTAVIRLSYDPIRLLLSVYVCNRQSMPCCLCRCIELVQKSGVLRDVSNSKSGTHSASPATLSSELSARIIGDRGVSDHVYLARLQCAAATLLWRRVHRSSRVLKRHVLARTSDGRPLSVIICTSVLGERWT